jgi:hypothetical protein
MRRRTMRMVVRLGRMLLLLIAGRRRPRSGVGLATRSHHETARPTGPTGATRHLASPKSTGTADATRAAGPPDPTPASRVTGTIGCVAR